MKDSKKNLVVLLIILALILVIGAWWTFNIFNKDSQIIDLKQDTQRQKFSKIRNMAINNINDFMDTFDEFGDISGSIFDDLVDNEQFNNLEETPVSISQDNIGNPKPFSH
jgi:hypothetical protein